MNSSRHSRSAFQYSLPGIGSRSISAIDFGAGIVILSSRTQYLTTILCHAQLGKQVVNMRRSDNYNSVRLCRDFSGYPAKGYRVLEETCIGCLSMSLSLHRAAIWWYSCWLSARTSLTSKPAPIPNIASGGYEFCPV